MTSIIATKHKPVTRWSIELIFYCCKRSDGKFIDNESRLDGYRLKDRPSFYCSSILEGRVNHYFASEGTFPTPQRKTFRTKRLARHRLDRWIREVIRTTALGYDENRIDNSEEQTFVHVETEYPWERNVTSYRVLMNTEDQLCFLQRDLYENQSPEEPRYYFHYFMINPIEVIPE